MKILFINLCIPAADEIQDLVDQLGEGSRKVMDMEKAYKRLEMEKDAIQGSLEETETAMNQELGKVQRLLTEMSNLKAETERHLAEKDGEIENIR